MIFARNSQNQNAITSDGNSHLQIAMFLRKSQRFPACGGIRNRNRKKSRKFGALREEPFCGEGGAGRQGVTEPACDIQACLASKMFQSEGRP